MRWSRMEGHVRGRNAMEGNMTKFRTAALALAGVLAITATSATSASAQWRRHGGWGWGPGIAAGVATGALIGSAVAARPYGYYGDPGYYGYAEPYAYDVGPTYYGSYGYRRLGYGPRYTPKGYRRVSCDGPSPLNYLDGCFEGRGPRTALC